MSSLLLKRGAILLLTIVTMSVLVATSEGNLLQNLPSESDVLTSILQRREQEQELLELAAEENKEALKELEKQREKLLEDLLEPEKRDQTLDYQELFDHSVRHAFIVEFTSEEFNGLVNDMREYNLERPWGNPYTDIPEYRSNNYRKVHVTYVSDNTVLEIPEVGIRSKGNIYSRRLPIDDAGNIVDTNYVLKFNATFDYVEGTPEYLALKKREVFDLEKIIFKYNSSNDAAFSNEIYSHYLFEQVNVPIPKASYAELIIVIDGEVRDKTLYNIFEFLDEEFIRKSLQETPTKEVGNLYKMIYPADLTPINDSNIIGVRNWETYTRPMYGRETNDEDTNYNDLILFTHQLSISNSTTRKLWLEQNFDVETFIRSMAVNVLTGNPDDYRGNLNNYYLYFDETGYATYLPFDYDNSLGSGWPGANDFRRYTLDNNIYDWGRIGPQERPLVDNILVYEEYQILYEDYLEYLILSDIYSYETYDAFVSVPKALYPDYFIYNDKEYFFNEKIADTLYQIEYYRNQREN